MRQFQLNKLFLLYFLFSITIFAQDFYTNAVLDYNNGNYAEAAKSFEKYIDSNPFNVTPYQYLVNCYIELEQNDKAISFLLESSKKFPKNIELKKTLGKLYVNSQQFSKAKRVFEEILRIYPKEKEVLSFLPKLHYNIAIVEFQKRNFKKALKNVDLSLKYDESIPDVWILKENILIQLKKYEKAEFLITEALNKFPENDKLLIDYSLLLISQNKIKEATEKLLPVWNRNPKNIQVGLQLSRLYRSKNKYTEAFDIYNSLLKIYPRKKVIYDEMLDYLSLLGKGEAQRKLYSKMEENFPNDKNIELKKIKTFVEEDSDSIAIIKYKKFILKNPNVVEAYVELGDLYKKHKMFEKGITLLKRALEKNLKDRNIYSLLGWFYNENKEYDLAINVYKEYHEKNPKDIYPPYEIGSIYLKQKELLLAKKYLEKALAINGEDALALAKISEIYKQMGEKEKAIKSFKKSFVQNIISLQKSEQTVLNSINANNNLEDVKIDDDVDRMKDFKYNIEYSEKYLLSSLSNDEYLKMITDLRKLYPKSALLLFYQGIYYERIGDFDSALIFYERVILMSSKVENAHLYMARIYEKRGNFSKAIVSYKRLLSIEPNNRNIYKNLIELYQKDNNLNILCNEWSNKFSANHEDKLLKEFLILALHKADRVEEAKAIINMSEK